MSEFVYTPPPPKITDNDRLSLTFFLAAIIHGIIILGIGFSLTADNESKNLPTLDIILVQTQNPSEAKDAKFLAQVSQQGGGNSEEQSRPRDLLTAPTMAEDPGLALQPQQQQTSRQRKAEKIAMLQQQQSDFSINTQDEPSPADDESIQLQQTTNTQTRTARLAQEISNIVEREAQRPRVKYMNSSTREFAPARYMREWIDRVERIGNLNYPDQARRQQLSGTLILNVAIKSTGELLKIDLRKSSGHKIIDDAAIRIVQLAAPYAPFPAKLKADTDVIHITRSWEFMSSQLTTH